MLVRTFPSLGSSHSDLLPQEMEKLQAKGEVAEEELRALEMDVTGKVIQQYAISSDC